MIKNLILLTGADDFRLRERLRFYRKAFRQKYPEGEIEDIDSETKFSVLENAVMTPNLFGSRRLVICEDFWSPENYEKQKT
jgi:DNA polymerase III delta subunit